MPTSPTPGMLGGTAPWGSAVENHENLPAGAEDFDFSTIPNSANLFTDYLFKGPLHFKKCTFPPDVRFTRCRFLGETRFEECTFLGDAYFLSSSWEASADFGGSVFRGATHFQDISVARVFNLNNIDASLMFWIGSRSSTTAIECRNAKFAAGVELHQHADSVDFSDTKIRQKLDASNLQVLRGGNFAGAEFGSVNFFGSGFPAGVDFSTTTIGGEADFKMFRVGDAANFTLCHFLGNADFSGADPLPVVKFGSAQFAKAASFIGRPFHNTTSFKKTTFTKAPQFHNCSLFPSTDFSDVVLPDHTSDDAEACYRSLRQLCNKVEAHHYELFFFTHELRARKEHEHSAWMRSVYWAYEWFSGFGLSVWRPLRALIALQVLFFLVYAGISTAAFWATHACSEPPVCTWKVNGDRASAILGHTVAQSLPFVAAVKDGALKPREIWFLPGAHVAVQILAILQSIASVLLLFLVGLGLRNHFRVK